MVVANAVAALNEINESAKADVFVVDGNNLLKLLAALNECTEYSVMCVLSLQLRWGQVFILDCLAKYNPRDAREAEMICERITPRLNHSNSAVVLSAVKVILILMNSISGPDVIVSLSRKLAPPLSTCSFLLCFTMQ